MKAIILRKWAIPMLTFLLSFAGICGANAQITELKDPNTALIHFYVRFTDQAEMSNLGVKYHINGVQHDATYTTENIMGRDYYKVIAEAPYDPVNRRLVYPVEIKKSAGGLFNEVSDLRWKEGLLTATQDCDNTMRFYGDAFLHVQQYHLIGQLIRYDYVYIDEDMEKSVMYEFDPLTGLSKMLKPDKNGECTWVWDMQNFQHVNNQTVDMNNYEYKKEVVLARKSAYHSYQYDIPYTKETYGDLWPEFGEDSHLQDDDVFHASLIDGATDNDIVFNSFREVAEERPWPTGCTATKSCIITSYAAGNEPTDRATFVANYTDYLDGFVGHLKIAIKALSKTWSAEAWIEQTNIGNDGWATFSTPYDVAVPEGLMVLAVNDLVAKENPTDPDRINMVSMSDYPFIPAGTGVLVKGRGTHKFHPAIKDGNDDDNDDIERATAGDDPNLIDQIADEKLRMLIKTEKAYAPYEPTGSSDPKPAFQNKMQAVPLNKINSLKYTSGTDHRYIFNYEEEKPVFKLVEAYTAGPNHSWDDDPDLVNGTGRIPPFKSYLALEITSPARELFPILPETANSLAAPTASLSSPAAIYDLQGRRYKATSSLKPGIYIVDGKKRHIKH